MPSADGELDASFHPITQCKRIMPDFPHSCKKSLNYRFNSIIWQITIQVFLVFVSSPASESQAGILQPNREDLILMNFKRYMVIVSIPLLPRSWQPCKIAWPLLTYKFVNQEVPKGDDFNLTISWQTLCQGNDMSVTDSNKRGSLLTSSWTKASLSTRREK